MNNFMEQPQLGLRRRRRAVPDEINPRGLFQNGANNSNDGLGGARVNFALPDLAGDIPEAQRVQGLIPPPAPIRVARPPQRRQRRPPSDAYRNYAFASWRVSQLYCLVSTFLAMLAIIVTSSKTMLSDIEPPQSFSSFSTSTASQWNSVEQVAKAAAVGLAARKGEKVDVDTHDLLQSIQQWWNSQQKQQQKQQQAQSSIVGSQGKNKNSVTENVMPSPFWWWRHNRQKESPSKGPEITGASFATHGAWVTLSEVFWNWIDPAIVLNPSPTTPTDIVDKILTSTPRLLAIVNFMLAMTYLVHSAIAAWFLGDHSTVSSSRPGVSPTAGAPGSVDWSSPTRERMGGFLVFKLLLISAVVAPDTLDLLILLTWYTTLSCLRSLDHLAHSTTTHLSALGQPPQAGVVHLLLLVLVGNILAAASCVALFHAAGWGMVLLLTCDCALLAADVLSHILKHFTCVLEDVHSRTIQSLEATQIQLHNEINSNNVGSSPNIDPPSEQQAHDEVRENTESYVAHNVATGNFSEDVDISNYGEESLRPSSQDEILQESRRLDQHMEVLDLAHARRLGIMDHVIFALDLICHALTVAHFSHIWSLHGVQFTLIDGVLALHLHAAISSACKKIAQRRNIHSIARDLQGLFPNASDQELRKASLAGDVCCICLGTMSTGGHVKKVPCGHLYHTHCLREVVERAQSIQAAKCPLCRSCLLDGRRQGDHDHNINPTRGAPTNVTPPAQVGVGAEPNTQQPQPPGGIDNALFRFSTEGILPVWVPVPAFSFEVVRRPTIGPPIGPSPPSAPFFGQQGPQLNSNIAQEENNANHRDQEQGATSAGGDDRALPRHEDAGVIPQVQQEEQAPSFLRRFLILAGAIPMSPEEEARALAQLVDMFPQYERSNLLRELRERGSAEAVAEAILMGVFISGLPRGE